MGEVHNEWPSERITAPEPVAPAAPTAPSLPYPSATSDPVSRDKTAPRSGRERRLWLAVGAAAVLLILFVVVLSGRNGDRSRASCEWIPGGSSTPSRRGISLAEFTMIHPEGSGDFTIRAEGNIFRIVGPGVDETSESCTIELRDA